MNDSPPLIYGWTLIAVVLGPVAILALVAFFVERQLGKRILRSTLTDSEREAVLYCVSCAQDYRDTLDVCEQPERYDRATQMIEAAMRLAIPNVGPAPVEGQRTASVTDVGGAGPTKTYRIRHDFLAENDKDQERRTMDTDNTQDDAEPSLASSGYRCGIATRESDLVGRLPLAAVLRLIAPGYSTCKRCKMPWAFTQCHCTKWNESNGMFPLCEHCWQRLSPSERLPYYRMLWQEWHEWGPVRDPAWHDVEAAVMAGL